MTAQVTRSRQSAAPGRIEGPRRCHSSKPRPCVGYHRVARIGQLQRNHRSEERDIRATRRASQNCRATAFRLWRESRRTALPVRRDSDRRKVRICNHWPRVPLDQVWGGLSSVNGTPWHYRRNKNENCDQPKYGHKGGCKLGPRTSRNS